MPVPALEVPAAGLPLVAFPVVLPRPDGLPLNVPPPPPSAATLREPTFPPLPAKHPDAPGPTAVPFCVTLVFVALPPAPAPPTPPAPTVNRNRSPVVTGVPPSRNDSPPPPPPPLDVLMLAPLAPPPARMWQRIVLMPAGTTRK